MIRRLAAIAPLAFVAAAFAACGGDGGGTGSGGVKVVATTAQVGALAREVAGDMARVTTLIPPGVDSHDFEASASDLKAIRDATLLLRNGIGLDDFLTPAIESAGGTKTVVTVTDGIELHPGAGEVDGTSRDMDPHVWHDPLNARIMVANIAEALAAADPANADRYRANAAAYQATLDETDRQIRALIDGIPAANRKLVTNHDAFGYFIRRYGLTFVGAVIPSTSTQAEPSAKDIAALVDLIRKEQVKAIFAESSLDPKVAEQIAKDTGVKIVDDLYGDSLGQPGSGAETVHGMLLANARKIAEALK
ncbi:MAG: zinc ABC transporter substrate-binding protein [Chloroflexi bacterium]|nr:zinc ABC transporter substrate-binding protein [Chloroflexota bacterium]